jgi:hypothetical protein
LCCCLAHRLNYSYADTDLREGVCGKWTPWPCKEGVPVGSDSSRLGLVFDKPSGRWEVFKRTRGSATAAYRPDKEWDFSNVISTAMLLYRLCCLFEIDVNTSTDRYKWAWEAALQHNDSGAVVHFFDHKGGASVQSSQFSAEFPACDLVELLDLLCSPRCPHPYNTLVAGAVA